VPRRCGVFSLVPAKDVVLFRVVVMVAVVILVRGFVAGTAIAEPAPFTAGMIRVPVAITLRVSAGVRLARPLVSTDAQILSQNLHHGLFLEMLARGLPGFAIMQVSAWQRQSMYSLTLRKPRHTCLKWRRATRTAA
jgi:hypothetical protein